MEDLKRGDSVRVIWRYKHSHNTLTNEKEYKVLLVKTDEYRDENDKFQILCDNGKKKWYKFNNTMFEMVSKQAAYTENQMECARHFARAISQSVQCFNASKENENAEAMYNDDIEKHCKYYLEIILKDEKPQHS